MLSIAPSSCKPTGYSRTWQASDLVYEIRLCDHPSEAPFNGRCLASRCHEWSAAPHDRLNRHAKFVRAHDDANDPRVSVILLGIHTLKQIAPVFVIHGIAIRRARRRQQACPGRRRQGHCTEGLFGRSSERAFHLFSAALCVVLRVECTMLHVANVQHVARHVARVCMWHVTPFNLQLNRANLAEAPVTIIHFVHSNLS